MNLDLNFFFPGLLGFWQIDGQNALVKGCINLVRLDKGRQLDLPFKGTAVPFNYYSYTAFLPQPYEIRCGFAFNKGFLLYKK